MSSPKSERTAALEEHEDELPGTPTARPSPEQPQQTPDGHHSTSPNKQRHSDEYAGSSEGAETGPPDGTPSGLASDRVTQASDSQHPSSNDDEFSFSKFDGSRQAPSATAAQNQPDALHQAESSYNREEYQSEIDAQIYSEASMSDIPSECESPAPKHTGHQPPSSGRPSHHSQEIKTGVERRGFSPGELRSVLSQPSASRVFKPRMIPAARGSNLGRSKCMQHPSQLPLVAEGSTDDTADLLKVVSFKFNEKAQKLQNAFSIEREELQYEVQQIRSERDAIHEQLESCKAQCKDLANTVGAHQARLRRAKDLAKFLEGIGNDLQSFRKEQEKYKATIVQAREVDLVDFEERLAARQQLEQQLETAKMTLEKLVATKDCEIQVVVEHRDSLQRQLEDRIGQLAEERDRSLRLQQRIDSLETSNRNGVESSVSQFQEALERRYSTLTQQQDTLAVDIAGLQAALVDLASSTNQEDHAAILAALTKTEHR